MLKADKALPWSGRENFKLRGNGKIRDNRNCRMKKRKLKAKNPTALESHPGINWSQQEKLASLDNLTEGIAHGIKEP